MTSDRFKEKEEDAQQPKLVEPAACESTPEERLLNYKDRIGKNIGEHYEILDLIGVGGMSAVYKARHTLLDKVVTIKVVLPKLISDEKTISRFKQEAKAATSLNHPNICKVNEYGVDQDGNPYIVMDYIEGVSLDEEIKRNQTIELDRALSIIGQICQGLYHAHSSGVIHRDIKPANILLVKNSKGEERVSILDFGIAKLVREDDSGPNLTKTGEIFGTPNYMSPEQCLGKTVDTRSDIYSVGCILFHMLQGHAPFESSSTLETLMSHLNDKVRNIEGAPSSVSEIVSKCMSKDPSLRYSTLEDLHSDLLLVQNGNYLKPKAKEAQNFPSKYIFVVIAAAFVVGTGILLNPTPKSIKEETNKTQTSGEQTLKNQIDSIFLDNQERQANDTAPVDSKPNTSKIQKLTWQDKHHKGDLAHRQGKTEEAYKLYKEALKLAQDNNAKQRDLAYLYEEIAGCALYLDKKEEASSNYYKAAAASQYIGDRKRLIANLEALANTQMSLAKYADAITNYEKILKIKGSTAKNSADSMDDWLRLGKAYWKAKQYANAKRSLDNLFRIAKQNPGKNVKTLALAHWVSANSQKMLGDNEAFKKHKELALRNGRLGGLSTEEISQIKSNKAL